MQRHIDILKYDWQFSRGEIKNAELESCRYNEWETVRVPHDYAIKGPFDPSNDRGNPIASADGFPVALVKLDDDGFPIPNHAAGRTAALPISGTAWYRRNISVPSAWSGKEISLEFDGVMSHCEIFINGKSVHKNVYGYTSFSVRITEFVHEGNNLLALRVEQAPWESRWYPGAGIYRNVRLVVKEKTCFAYHSAFITTPVVTDERAEISVTADVADPTPELNAEIIVKDTDGRVVGSVTANVDLCKIKASLVIEFPRLWSDNSPTLYYAELRLFDKGELIDTEAVRFGIRSLGFDRENGFTVNGKYKKLKGVCMHHDMGALGAAVSEAAIRRQLKILSEMGCNAIRTAHNPPAPELLNIADEMGFYVIVEQFDQWRYNKTANGYGMYFDKWAEYDFTSTLRRDRNHPSVIMWSIGNEIFDQMQNDGGQSARFLTSIAHREDPSRMVTAGFHRDDDARKNGLTDAVDVVGWNYRPFRYKLYHELTNEIFYGSETESCVSSRGVYYIPEKSATKAEERPVTLLEHYEHLNREWRRYPGVEIPVNARPDTQVNSYDLSAPDWAYYPEVEFAAQDDHPYALGEFVWTGFDYLGEPTPYGIRGRGGKLARSSFFGVVDLAGLPKDRYYSYQAKWSGNKVLHPFPHWNWNEGDVLPIHCYSSYDRVELSVNGKSYGICEKKPNSDNCLERYRLMWNDVKYQVGEYTVKALDKNGNVLDSVTVRTAGEPASIEISADREHYLADGDDLCYVTVRLLDKDGVFCPLANNTLTFSVEGCGEFIASDNGDPTDLEIFHMPTRDAFNGMAVGIFRTLKGQSGTMTVTVSSDGLTDTGITVEVK